MDPECEYNDNQYMYGWFKLTTASYNGTSDLQLERMNVYFNEVGTSYM
jgi:hypothetical protein